MLTTSSFGNESHRIRAVLWWKLIISFSLDQISDAFLWSLFIFSAVRLFLLYLWTWPIFCICWFSHFLFHHEFFLFLLLFLSDYFKAQQLLRTRTHTTVCPEIQRTVILTEKIPILSIQWYPLTSIYWDNTDICNQW